MAQRSTVPGSVERSPIAVAAGFVAAFVVASLAVQLLRSVTASQPVSATTAAQPVVAHQSTLWQVFGSR